MVMYLREWAAAALGIVIIVADVLVLAPVIPLAAPLIALLGALIATVPAVWIFYYRFRTARQVEQQFILFIMDLTDSINAGMTLPLALDHVSNRNYRALSPHVNELAAKVNWGIPFDHALDIFAKKINIAPIRRAISTINETYKVGGRMVDALNAVSESLLALDKLKKERSASVHAQIVTSYIIFFIFIFIVIILHSFLIPTVTQQASGISLGEGTTFIEESLSTAELSRIFSVFIVVQGFFAGLATGKMSEGSLVAGLKHSIILIAAGFTIFSIAVQVPIFGIPVAETIEAGGVF